VYSAEREPVPSLQPAQQTTPVLILAYYFPPDNYSGAARPGRFARYLPDLGFPVRVIAVGESAEQSDWIRRVEGETEQVHHRSLAALIERVVRKSLMPHDEGISWVARAVREAVRWHRREPFATVFSTAPPVVTHLAALWLKRRLSVRWVADFRDPLAGNPFRTQPIDGYVDPWVERQIFRHADAVIANTEAVGELWRRRYPQWARKVNVIWNGFDPADPLGAMPLPPRAYKVMAHIGEIYCDRHPGILLRAFRRQIDRGALEPGAHRIRLIGNLDADATFDRNDLTYLLERGCLELIPHIPQEQARAEAAQSDYLVLLDSMAGLQVPAKLFDYIRVGRPILAVTSQTSAVASILARSGIRHTLLSPGPTDEIDTRLMEFLRYSTESLPHSEWFTRNFNAVEQTEKLAALLKQPQL
jgi:glycosyltransferase involved in cell wall biosynthesis